MLPKRGSEKLLSQGLQAMENNLSFEVDGLWALGVQD